MKKKYVQTGVFVLLSFVLSLLLAITALLCVFQVTVFDSGFFRRQIDQSGYAEHLMESLQETLISYGQSSGFEASVFREAVTMDMLRADIYREVSRLYEDKGKKIDAGLFLYHLDQCLLQNAEERGLALSDENKEAIYYLARVSAEAYVDIVGIPFTDQISGILSRLRRLNMSGLLLLGLLDLVCVALVFFCIPSRRKKLEAIMHAAAGALLIVFIPTVLLMISDTLKRLPFTGKALYAFSQQYIRGLAQTALMTISVLALVWLCTFIYRSSYIFAERRKTSSWVNRNIEAEVS